MPSTIGIVDSLTTYAETMLTDAPVGWWRLNEASGTAAANQTGTVNGIYVNTPTLQAGPLASDGNSVGLNGTNQYVTLVAQTNINNVTTNNFTIEAWFLCNDVSPATPQIIWEEGGTVNGASMYVYQNEVFGLMWTTSTIRKQISFSVANSTAYHVVFISTVTGTRCELYLNGQSVGTAATNTATALGTHVGANGIGAVFNNTGGDGARSHVSTNTTTGGWPFNGRIGDVARYDYALSAVEVANHYSRGTIGN